MKLKFKLAAGVVSTLMFVGTAAAAVSYTPGTYEGEAIGRNVRGIDLVILTEHQPLHRLTPEDRFFKDLAAVALLHL